MKHVAIIEKYPTTYNYKSIFPFEFDLFSLVEEKVDKILKRDIQLNIDGVKEKYDYIILVGKEPCKMVADIRSVVEYQGFLVNNKYLAMLNPIAVKLNPSYKTSFDKSINDIILHVTGEAPEIATVKLIAISDEEEAKKYLLDILLKASTGEILEIVLDTETYGLYPRDGYILGISISYSIGEGVYIDSMAMSDSNISILQNIINLVRVIFHNMKFDIKMLNYHYKLIFNMKKVHDTMLEHYVLDENSAHDLKSLCLIHTNLGDYDKGLKEWKAQYCKSHGLRISDFTYDLIPFEILSSYAGYDAIGTLQLHNKFYKYVEKNEKLLNVYKNILIKGANFLNEIEENGIPINEEAVIIELTNIEDELTELTKSLYEYKEIKQVEQIKNSLFNVNSTAHVGCLFFEVLKLPVLKLTGTGNPSADADVLEQLATEHPIANTINNIKQLKKIKSTYLDKILSGLDADSRFRTSFNLHTTTSGRLSSSGKLNAQNLPRKNKAPKRCMVARDNFKIVSQDLKTAEMYVASVLSGDKVLQQIFIDGQDYHGTMAVYKFNLPCEPNEVEKLFPDERQAAKTISFEILYKLNYKEPALKNFKKLKQWLQENEEFIKKNGYIYSFFGRKRRLADAFSPNKKEAQHHVRSGINFLVQSVSSDINLLAGIEMQEWITENNLNSKMLIWGLVHDSILAEVHDDYIELYRKKLAEFTQKDRGLSIPNCPIGIDVEIGQSYGTTKRI